MQGIEQTQPGVDVSDGGAGGSVELSWTGSLRLAPQNPLFDLQPRGPPGVQLQESVRRRVRAGRGQLSSRHFSVVLASRTCTPPGPSSHRFHFG